MHMHTFTHISCTHSHTCTHTYTHTLHTLSHRNHTCWIGPPIARQPKRMLGRACTQEAHLRGGRGWGNNVPTHHPMHGHPCAPMASHRYPHGPRHTEGRAPGLPMGQPVYLQLHGSQRLSVGIQYWIPTVMAMPIFIVIAIIMPSIGSNGNQRKSMENQ